MSIISLHGWGVIGSAESTEKHPFLFGPVFQGLCELADWRILEALSLDALLGWAATQPWASAMRDCAQDPQWHAEGDVWTHTLRVCHELEGVEGWHQLSADHQSAIRFAAIFHDSAKPLTMAFDPIAGRLRSPKHAVKGESLTRSVLRDLDCPFETRELICSLVRYHGKPVFLAADQRPEIELARLSWLTRHDLLYILAMADLRGRKSAESNRTEDDLLWYRALASENHCLNQPYPVANEKARFLLGRRELLNLHYAPHEDYRCQVTLMSGLPGNGKDTWLRTNRPELPVVSLDQLRSQMGVDPDENQGSVAQAARERCREFLRQRSSFALNATNTTQQMRAKWIELFARYDAHIEVVSIERMLSETLQQNREREEPVPDSVIGRLHERSEPVHRLEAHRVTHVLSEPLQTRIVESNQ